MSYELKDFANGSVADFVAQMGVDPSRGLTREQAMRRRQLYGTNHVSPPLHCPSWVCCLLPCITRMGPMSRFQRLLPREATVRRCTQRDDASLNQISTRMRMDAVSVVYGDVLELNRGEVVPADVRVIECSDDCVVDQSSLFQSVRSDLDLEAAASDSAVRRKHVQVDCSDANDPIKSRNVVLMGSSIVTGHAVGIVIATGDDSVWGQLMMSNHWPLTHTDSEQCALVNTCTS